MQDRLEEFVKANRAAFDDAEPRPELWKSIERSLEDEDDEKVKPLQSRLWMWKVAVAVLLVAVTYLAVDRFVPRSEMPETVSTLEEFKDLEAFYTSIIDEKHSKLTNEMEGEEFFNYLEADIEELDAIYVELRETYTTGVESQEVLDRLVHLLRQRLHLINSQLDILEDAKNPVQDQDLEGTTAL